MVWVITGLPGAVTVMSYFMDPICVDSPNISVRLALDAVVVAGFVVVGAVVLVVVTAFVVVMGAVVVVVVLLVSVDPPQPTTPIAMANNPNDVMIILFRILLLDCYFSDASKHSTGGSLEQSSSNTDYTHTVEDCPAEPKSTNYITVDCEIFCFQRLLVIVNNFHNYSHLISMQVIIQSI
jgi:hypothetical protein